MLGNVTHVPPAAKGMRAAGQLPGVWRALRPKENRLDWHAPPRQLHACCRLVVCRLRWGAAKAVCLLDIPFSICLCDVSFMAVAGRAVSRKGFTNQRLYELNTMSSAFVPASAAENASSRAHANADAAELTHFGDLAEQWWDERGVLHTLHAINPLRLGWISQHVPLQGLRVLDVGCGGGILAESMARAGARVLGVDLAEKSLQVARAHAQAHQVPDVEYRCISIEDLAREQPQGFDVVTCMEMLEHVPDPASVVQACADLVKPGGWVFFSTIARNPKAFLMAIVGAEYLLRLLPRGTHTYAKFIKPSELARHARQAGLQVLDSEGLHYNPLTRNYWLGRGVDVNYMLAVRKI